MDQSRYDFFLDDGWNLIGQLHVWLSRWPHAAHEQSNLVDLIANLQSVWGSAEDLGFRRLSRICLALEQSMERFCAQNLECTLERLNDVANAVACFQEVLLGLEATRVEPAYDLSSIAVLERHATLPIWTPPEELTRSIMKLDPSPIASDQFELSSKQIVAHAENHLSPSGDVTDDEHVPERDYVDRTLLVMLEDFVSKIDETCHKLHVTMVTDKMPYVSTTSRLEQLAHSTRELVSDISRQARAAVSTIPFEAPLKIDPPMVSEVPPKGLELNTDDSIPVDQTLSIGEQRIDADTECVAVEEESTETAVISSQETAESLVVEAPPKPRRVLIVEESLFFRHLIGLAVQSAGFETISAETVENGLEHLHQSPDFHAILIGSVVSAEIAQAISLSRQQHGSKVIGLVASDDVGTHASDIDACVSRSNPIQLISKLNQVLSEPVDPIRMSA